MKLKEYFKENCIDLSQFAKKIGVTTVTLHNYLNGKYLPKLGIAYKIEKATQKKVTIYDWLSDNSTLHKQ